MAAVRFERIEKRFGDVSVIAPLDLAIEDGEFFSFVGPSGCGKSTLLHLVAGIAAPSAGALWFDGERVDHLPPQARDVAMVFQGYALYPHMTVRDNIGFPLRNRGVARQTMDADVGRVAETLGLSGLLERRPRELSGGQRQRVALARALVRRPRVFLLDEPLSNLDARLRFEMRGELKRLHAAHGITTIYVTHDQEEAMALSDRIAVLHAGRLQQCDRPERVYADPDNLLAAMAIGSPPLNVLDPRQAPALAALLPGGSAATMPVLIGVRPADVLVGAPDVGSGLTLDAVVSMVEPTGAETWVIGEVGNQRIKGRAAPGTSPVPGAPARFSVVAGRVLLFDSESGTRVRP